MNDDSSFRPKAPDKTVMISSVCISLVHGTPTISVQMEEVSRCLILDTGSNVSILQPGLSS